MVLRGPGQAVLIGTLHLLHNTCDGRRMCYEAIYS